MRLVYSLPLLLSLACTHDTDKLRRLRNQWLDASTDASDSSPVEDSGIDAVMARDSGLEVTVQDGITSRDALPDVFKPDCYVNGFDNDADLGVLVAQNGVWERNPEGFLRQSEVGGGWRVSYLDNAIYGDFEASLRVRMDNGLFGSSQHTGLVFRYNRASLTGYDENLDRGYILEIEDGNGSSFSLTLEDMNHSRLYMQRVDGQYGQWHTISVRATGNSITALFNGSEVFTFTNDLYRQGHIGFGSHAGQSDFDDLEVCQGD